MPDLLNVHYQHVQQVRASVDEHIWGRGTPNKDLKYISSLVRTLQELENEAYQITQVSFTLKPEVSNETNQR